MKKILLASLMAVLLVIMAACGSSDDKEKGTESTKKDTTITLGVTPWTSTVPPTAVAKLIIEDMGYSVKEVKADVGNVVIGLSRGDIDAFMDIWLPGHVNHITKFEDDIEELSISYDDAELGIIVPAYMTDINSIEDLKGKEDLFNNELFGIEEGSGGTPLINDAIDKYELDMTQVNSSEGGMLAQAQRFMSAEKPVVFYGWRPHSMFNKFDLKLLEDEKNIFESSTVLVYGNNGLKEKAPDVHAFLSNWSITLDEVEQMILEIEEDGKEPEELAREWIDNNQDKVDEMLGK